MKETAKLSFLLLASRWKRTLSFVLLLALLSLTAGLLGNHFLTQKDAVDPIRVAVVDQDDTPLSRMFLSSVVPAVESSSFLQLKNLTLSEAEAQMRGGNLAGYGVIPPDFIESVMSGKNLPVKMVLNPKTPMQSSLLSLFAEQVLGVLKNSQTGIYASLEYVSDQAPELYEKAYRQINLRLMQTAFALDKLTLVVPVSVTGEAGLFAHYLFGVLFFLLLLSCGLFSPLIKENFPQGVLVSLGRQRVGALQLTLGWTLGWWGWVSLIGLAIFAVYGLFSDRWGLPFSPLVLPALLVVLLFLATIGCFLGFVFQHRSDAMVLLGIYSLASLFFSGGVIPLIYLPSGMSTVANLFPSYWGVQLLESAALGSWALLPFGLLVGTSVVLVALTSLVVHRQTKGVKR